jgi:hypothetical protein
MILKLIIRITILIIILIIIIIIIIITIIIIKNTNLVMAMGDVAVGLLASYIRVELFVGSLP